jgi:hypothetical protein
MQHPAGDAGMQHPAGHRAAANTIGRLSPNRRMVP